MRRATAARATILVGALTIATPLRAGEVAGPADILDGNRLDIGGQRLRLYGVRAPDLDATCVIAGREQACGRLARTALMDLTAGVEIRCRPVADPSRRDGDAETVAICRAGGYDLSEGMAYTGWAVAAGAITDRYLDVERTARRRGHGMWRRARTGK